MHADFESLIDLPEASRDDAWEKDFFKFVVTTKAELIQDQPVQGPDGWPYLMVKTGPGGTEPFLELLRWSYTRGVGIALNTHKMLPDYVFTYGMLWNYAETGEFLSSTAAARAGQVEIGPNAIVGAPTEKYLPKYVRGILKEFLAAQGFPNPKIVVVSSADYKEVDLVFSIESLGNLAPKDQSTLAEALTWFLPMHYSLILGSERSLRGFVDL